VNATDDELIRSLHHRAYVANRRGDRCGWVLYSAIAEHLRDVVSDRMPWLRDDPIGEDVRRGHSGIYHLRSGRTVTVT
jgi:RNA:NAD 2'-phosphotransferase (TPT1/KptA family)